MVPLAVLADAKLPARRVIALQGSGVAGDEIRFAGLEMHLPGEEKVEK
jgi:hypothetical protein